MKVLAEHRWGAIRIDTLRWLSRLSGLKLEDERQPAERAQRWWKRERKRWSGDAVH